MQEKSQTELDVIAWKERKQTQLPGELLFNPFPFESKVSRDSEVSNVNADTWTYWLWNCTAYPFSVPLPRECMDAGFPVSFVERAFQTARH